MSIPILLKMGQIMLCYNRLTHGIYNIILYTIGIICYMYVKTLFL